MVSGSFVRLEIMFLLILCVTIPFSQCRPSESKFGENESNMLQDNNLERIRLSQEDKPVLKQPNASSQLSEIQTAKPGFNPPLFFEHAKIARYVVHYMDWTVIAAISSRYPGSPSATPMSVADGPTGVPYIFITSLDPTTKDLQKNPNASFVYSYAQTDYCTKKKYDPEDPRCGKLFLSGKVVKVPSYEIPAAKKALFSRHPAMKLWQYLRYFHFFYFAKLDITRISLLDFFGKRSHVSLKDYYAAKI